MEKSKIDKILSNAIQYIKIDDPWEPTFEEVALGLYDLHRELNPVYSKYDIGELTDWRTIPLMPISEFKKGNVGIVMSDRMPFPGVEFFSSGTSQRDKSRHRMYDTEAYRLSIAQGSRVFVASPIPMYRVILLSPKIPNSSLVYMMEYISQLHDYRGVKEFFDGMTSEVEVQDLLSTFIHQEEPVILFGTSLAFYDLMSTINELKIKERVPITMPLPSQSLMLETGGWKGRDIQMSPRELTTQVSMYFSIPFNDCIREYSMSEMSTQLYTWGNNYTTAYRFPQWLDVRIVDPLSQTELPRGESGVIAFVDLANVWSCPFILTEDIGHMEFNQFDLGGSLVLEGRATNAPEKGCSLSYVDAVSK